MRAQGLAEAARVVDGSSGSSLQQALQNAAVPRAVKDALQAMNGAPATVLGTMTPNVADTQHPLQKANKSSLDRYPGEQTAKYRDMLRRMAADPVPQIVQFELLMKLFFQHVLNFQTETLDCRWGGVRYKSREWCADGAAASSTGAGMLGPIVAFGREIEAQGHGSFRAYWIGWFAGICKCLVI